MPQSRGSLPSVMMFSPRFTSLSFLALVALGLAGIGRCAAPATGGQIARLGKQIFFDASLSASGRLSCASCHDPRHAYAPANADAVQRGGADLQHEGTRAVPSLRYTLRRTPIWSKEFQSDRVEASLEFDNVPLGGFDWDGRFDTLREQAEAAFLAGNQAANENRSAFAARLARSRYAAEFEAIFGLDIRAQPEQATAAAARAVEQFELTDASFAPYSSRFDAFLAGKARLTRQEARGLRWFLAPAKGNCAACHPAAKGADGSHPLFTDFGYEVLGVPRNAAIPANRDATHFDLGLCGPLRTDLAAQALYCGMFKTPSLRNVATRAVFFHNGSVRSLREAVRFYVTRDREPQRWYGQAQPYDDLPVELRRNVDHFDAPFNHASDTAPALSEAQIADVVAFLGTLTDRDVRAVAHPKP
jgi:cytochrome c peroxidase